MARRRCQSGTCRRRGKKRGCGLVNTLINKLPFELHIPGYNYCGPGTKLSKRLQRGDQGINPLDEACKVHDIAYSNFQDVERRNIADRELADAAAKRLKTSDSSLGEKLAALGVTGIMKVKTKFGLGLKHQRKRNLKKRGGQINLKVAQRKKSSLKKPKQRIIPIPISIPKRGVFFHYYYQSWEHWELLVEVQRELLKQLTTLKQIARH